MTKPMLNHTVSSMNRAALRCDAMAADGQRCGLVGRSFRDGRWVCFHHEVTVPAEYAGPNRFNIFGKTMMRAGEADDQRIKAVEIWRSMRRPLKGDAPVDNAAA
jgi:hypothetical protein